MRRRHKEAGVRGNRRKALVEMKSLCGMMRSLSEEMDDLIKEMRTIRWMATGLLAMTAVINVLVLVILIQVRSM